MVSAKFGIPLLASSNKAAGLKIAEVFRRMLLNMSARAKEGKMSSLRSSRTCSERSMLTCNRGEICCSLNMHEIDAPDRFLQEEQVSNEEELSIEFR